MSEEENEDYQEGMGVGGAILPFATALASLALGVVLGGAVIWIAKPAEKVEVNVPRELTAAELEAACAPAVLDVARDLGLGLSSFVSVGNKADVSGNDLLQYMARVGGKGVTVLVVHGHQDLCGSRGPGNRRQSVRQDAAGEVAITYIQPETGGFSGIAADIGAKQRGGQQNSLAGDLVEGGGGDTFAAEQAVGIRDQQVHMLIA